ncbi:MAG: hypothetical protein AB1598_05920 [Thermodesulfobacteriota bacterium]
MKNPVTPALIAFIIFTALIDHAHAQKDPSHDFRSTRWGMTPAQVKLTENSAPVSETDLPPYDLAVSYKGKYEGLDAEIGYLFTNDKLVLGGYAVTNKYGDPAQYVKDYEKIKGVLAGEYGQPARDDKVWREGKEEANPEGYGKAVAEGRLVLQSAWRTPRTEIFLTLEGGNVNTILSVLYYSVELNPRVEERRLKQEMENF